VLFLFLLFYVARNDRERNRWFLQEEDKGRFFLLSSSPSSSFSSSSSSSPSCAQASGDACSAALLAFALEGMPKGPNCSPSAGEPSGVALAAVVRIGERAVAVAAAGAAAAAASKLPLLPPSSRLALLPLAATAAASERGTAPEPGAPNLSTDDAFDVCRDISLLVAARCILALCAAVDAYGLIVGTRDSVADSGLATALEACRPATERPKATVTSPRLGGSNSR